MIRTLCISAILLSILFASCGKDHCTDCLKGAGPVKTERREISGIHYISLSGKIDLRIIQDSVEYIDVKAGENLIPSVITEKNGDRLSVRNENRCNWVRSFKNKIEVEIHTKALKDIYCEGPGNIESGNVLYGDTISVNLMNASGKVRLSVNTQVAHLNIHTGVADLTVSGVAGISYMWSAGNGVYQCSDLQTNIAYITSKSSNQAYINVKDVLDAELYRAGNIYCKGNPSSVKKYRQGSGDLILENQ